MNAYMQSSSIRSRIWIAAWIAAWSASAALGQVILPEPERPVGPPGGTPGVVSPPSMGSAARPSAMSKSEPSASMRSERKATEKLAVKKKTTKYVNDASIDSAVRSKLLESKAIDAAAIKVETQEGTVNLSGYAKSADQRTVAEKIAKDVKGVNTVKNAIAVRP